MTNASSTRVAAERLDRERRQVDRQVEVAERVRAAAGEHRGDEHDHAVDEPVPQEARRKRRPSLEEERLHTLAGERAQLVSTRGP